MCAQLAKVSSYKWLTKIMTLLLSPCRPTLPEFYLDFGYVVYGQVVSRLVTLRNTGHCPVSFTTAHTALEVGFSSGIDCVYMCAILLIFVLRRVLDSLLIWEIGCGRCLEPQTLRGWSFP